MQTWYSGITFNAANGWFNWSVNDRDWLADVNGDGLPDFIGLTDNYIGVQLNTGSGFGALQTWYSGATFKPANGSFNTPIHNRVWLPVVNGEGLPDFIGLTDNYIGVQLNTGSGFGALQTWYSGTTFNPANFFFIMILHHPRSTLYPYTALFPSFIGLTDNYIGVQLNTGSGFGALQTWYSGTTF